MVFAIKPPLSATASPAPAAAEPPPAKYSTGDRIADALLPSLEPVIRDWIKRDAPPPGPATRNVYTIQTPDTGWSWIPPDGERQHAMFPLALAAAAQGVNLWLVAGAGTGKSHLASSLAEALNRPYEVDSFSSQTTEAKLLGYTDAHGQPVITPLARAFEHGKVFIADEADASGAVAVGLNRCLANSSATMAGRLLNRHADFLCIATANTRGSGKADGFRREPQDAALLDRFFMLEIPQDVGLERHLCGLAPSDKYKSPECDVTKGGKLDPESWYNIVSSAREHARRLQISATFLTSNRPVSMGCKLAAAGIGKYWLCQGLLRRSLAQNDWDKLADALHVEP
jgi:hypothetical protein